MKSSRPFFILALFLFTGLPHHILAQFELKAEIRPRTEFRNGFKTPRSSGEDVAFFTEQRSRLYFDFRESKFALKFALQDVRIWGEDAQIHKQQDGNTFLSEAWGEYFIKDGLSIKLGRQIISYDNQRFFGGLEWAQQGRRHDAVLLKFVNSEKNSQLDLGFAHNSDDDVPEPAYLQNVGAAFYSNTNDYRNFQYAWWHRDFEHTSISALALNAGYQNLDSTTSYKQTIGLIYRRNAGSIAIGSDLYYQTGQFSQKTVNAYLAGLNLTYHTKVSPLTLGIEFISGKNADDERTDIRHFSPDFGTNHIHNGLMDYFFVGPSHGPVGLTDVYFKSKHKLGKGQLAFEAHEFFMGSKQFEEEGGTLSKFLGAELDLVYSRNLDTQVTLNLGYSHLFASSSLLTLRNANLNNNNWVWVMVTFSPTLLKITKE